jgi:hypothetical protein
MRKRSLLIAVLGLTAAACTTGGPAAGAAPQIEVEATLSGAASGHVALAHAIDAADACRVAGAAAAHAATASGVVETPDGPPAYRFQLTDRGYAFALSAAPYAGALTFNDASNAGLWVTTPDGTWTLPTQPEAGVGIAITFAADGGSGTFRATGLVLMKNGAPDRTAKRLDVAGSWRCQAGA